MIIICLAQYVIKFGENFLRLFYDVLQYHKNWGIPCDRIKG